MLLKRTAFQLACLLVAIPVVAQVADTGLVDEKTRYRVEIEDFEMRVIPRTPDQMSAFYEGRGFGKEMLMAIRAACLMTVIIRNRSSRIVWLEPGRWRLTTVTGQSVRRLTREHWRATWEGIKAPLAHRSTFGWTQLPTVRDLRPAEPVGGNLALVPVSGPFTLEARFATGENKKGPEWVLKIPDLSCPQ
jgi:hypothetical protein